MPAVTFTTGMVLYMHELPNHWLVLGLGVAGLIATFFSWFSNVVKEAQQGDHTPVVQLHLRYGMILFIASEVMFFVGWFWSWFDFALFPNTLTEVVGGKFPPVAIEAVMDPFALPLLNTLILLCSGTTVTWRGRKVHGMSRAVLASKRIEIVGAPALRAAASAASAADATCVVPPKPVTRQNRS